MLWIRHNPWGALSCPIRNPTNDAVSLIWHPVKAIRGDTTSRHHSRGMASPLRHGRWRPLGTASPVPVWSTVCSPRSPCRWRSTRPGWQFRGGPCRRVGCLLRSGYPGVLGDQPLSSSGQHGSEAVGTIPGACWWGKPNGQGSLLSAGDAQGGQRWVGVGGGVGMVGREQVEYCPQCLLWRALICGGCRIARPRR
jgi:hypothetical protein